MERICNILVVEDDDAVRELLGAALDLAGYRFCLVGTGAAMRAALDEDDFDVAIIDVSLRDGEDGFSLALEAQAKGCGVILTTGDPQQQARLAASSHRQLLKPFRLQQLTSLIDQVLKDTAALCVPRLPDDQAPLPARP